jgi:hypothetical protein
MSESKDTFVETMIEEMHQRFKEHFRLEIDVISRWKEYQEMLFDLEE